MDAVVEPDAPADTRSRPFARLACALTGHRPDAPPIWNHGHGFAFCTRCARPIVRTIVHGWRLPPRGYRIRWPTRDHTPAADRPAMTAAERAPARTRVDFMGDPLAGTVSSAFDFDDFASSSRAVAEPEPPRRLAP